MRQRGVSGSPRASGIATCMPLCREARPLRSHLGAQYSRNARASAPVLMSAAPSNPPRVMLPSPRRLSCSSIATGFVSQDRGPVYGKQGALKSEVAARLGSACHAHAPAAQGACGAVPEFCVAVLCHRYWRRDEICRRKLPVAFPPVESHSSVVQRYVSAHTCIGSWRDSALLARLSFYEDNHAVIYNPDRQPTYPRCSSEDKRVGYV